MKLIIEKYKKYVIRILNDNNVYWFCGKDICKILSLTNVSTATQYIDSSNKKIEKMETVSGIQNMVILSGHAVTQLMYRCRYLDKSQDCLQYLNKYLENNIYIRPFKESDYIGFIEKSLSVFKSERQFSIGSYRIDLYFPVLKIAVECDENGHQDRDAEYENNREGFIKEQLDCEFIRFNPDSNTFDLSTVIDYILRLWINKKLNIKLATPSLLSPVLSHSLSYEMPPINTPIINTPIINTPLEKKVATYPTKECIKCKETKSLKDFFDRPANKDGKENICRDCYIARQLLAKEKKKQERLKNNERKCTKCNIIRELIEYDKSVNFKDGYSPTCLKCNVIIDKTVDKIEKTCSKCKETKAMGEYHNCRTSWDGKFNYCKVCASIRNKMYKDSKKKKVVSPELLSNKVCNQCGEDKEIDSYKAHQQSLDGYYHKCTDCIQSNKRDLNI
jgi:very-short-patch-repair endonuclease